jgi:hypothetical protein
MEFIDTKPEANWPYTIFDALDGVVVDHACCYNSAAEGYGLTSNFGRMVVILRTAPALPADHRNAYHA